MCNYEDGVSVIVPIYNAEHFLNQSVTSITKQSFKDLEIICVIDRKSDDESEKLLKKIAKKDKRIKIIKGQDGCGPGYNRNIGLQHVSKKYIGFVDADDMIEKDFYERLYDFATRFDADIAVTDARVKSLSDGDHFKNLRCELIKYFSFSKKLPLLEEFFVNNKIYRTELIKGVNHIFFSENLIYEHIIFLINALYFSHKVISVPGSLYEYQIGLHSLSVDPDMSAKRSKDSYKAMNMVFDFIKKNSISQEDSKIIIGYSMTKFGHMAMRQKNNAKTLFEKIKKYTGVSFKPKK